MVQLGRTEFAFLLRQSSDTGDGIWRSRWWPHCCGNVATRPLQADLGCGRAVRRPCGIRTVRHGASGGRLSFGLFTAASLVWMWLLRRFGFLTNLMVWLVQGMALAWPLDDHRLVRRPLDGRASLPVAVAAWALWVILWHRNRHRQEISVVIHQRRTVRGRMMQHPAVR